MEGEKVLSVSGLSKRYDKFRLDSVALDVRRGEIVGFIGRNGAGKTTALKALMDYLHPDAGEIEFFGKPLKGNEAEVKRRTGFVSGGVDYYMRRRLRTITDVTRGFYSNWDEGAYRRYMAEFGLDEYKTPAELSAGMKVKYNLALALSHRAQLLLLDEPTSNVDSINEGIILKALKEQKNKKSIILVSHRESTMAIADIIYRVKDGRMLEC